MTFEQYLQKIEAESSPKLCEFNKKMIGGNEQINGLSNSQMRELAKLFILEMNNVLTFPLGKVYEIDMARSLAVCKSKLALSEKIEILFKLSAYFDNWAIVDVSASELKFKPNQAEEILAFAARLLSENAEEFPFRVRFGVNFLMQLLRQNYSLSALNGLVKKAPCGVHYYIDMVIAWYYAEEMSKDFETALSAMKDADLSDWVFNKALQKGRESRRVTEEQKELLKSLKRAKQAKKAD